MFSAYLKTEGKSEYVVHKVPKEGDDAPVEGSGFLPAAKSALKKAENALKAHVKKQGREKELEAQRLKEDEARSKVLEEAKKIVITDPNLPAKKIRLDQEEGVTLGERYKVVGRVQNVRKQKDIYFIGIFSPKLYNHFDGTLILLRTPRRIWKDAMFTYWPACKDL